MIRKNKTKSYCFHGVVLHRAQCIRRTREHRPIWEAKVEITMEKGWENKHTEWSSEFSCEGSVVCGQVSRGYVSMHSRGCDIRLNLCLCES